MKSMTRKIPLYISLYCREADWNGVIKDAIFPFLKDIIRGEELQYTLHLSREKGESIGLTLWCQRDLASVVLDNTDAHFKDFMQKKLQQEAVDVKKVTTLFMPFPNNSIQYGIHEFSPSIATEEYLSCWQNATEVVFTMLAKERFDMNDLSTICLYLNISLLLSCPGCIPHVVQVFKEQFPDNREVGEADERYQESIRDIEAIFDDCMNLVTISNAELKWVYDWIKSFELLLGQNNGMNMHVILQTNILVRKQLSLNFKGSLILDFFLFKLLTNKIVVQQGVCRKPLPE